MKVIGKIALDDFKKKHSDVRSQVEAWLTEVEEAEWKKATDVKQRYPRATFIHDKRVVFKLKGDKYRLDTIINFKVGNVLVKRAGTHAEYDKWSFEKELGE